MSKKGVLVLPVVSAAFCAVAVAHAEEYVVAPSMLARVLPLPGEFAGEAANNHGQVFRIYLKPGLDRTRDATKTPKGPLPKRDSDITVRFSDPSSSFGNATSEKPIEILIGGDAEEMSRTGRATIDWTKSFASAVQKQGRTMFLSGETELAVADPGTSAPTYSLRYKFGPSSSISWDAQSSAFRWFDIHVVRQPAESQKK